MPETPTIDLTQLDFTKPVATHAQIYTRLLQAGRFALLDGVARFSTEEPVSIGFKEIRADDWWCTDHVPGRPLFPGVLMIEAGAQLASWDYLMRHSEQRGFLGFGGLNETRFRGQVEPGDRLVFVARELRVRKTMFIYAVKGFVENSLVFETEVIGVAL
ncbi:MAG: beta-hydroxyacyl-ACP dehydratase [Planctomycetota bacterium]|nr:beta-hydroxyacyl-ACP dehydratase [Planctomycetota bacterium]